MYTLISAIVLDKPKNSRWEPIDINNKRLDHLLRRYLGVMISIDTPAGIKYVDMKKYENELANYDQDIYSWLLSKWGINIANADKFPTDDIRHVLYEDVYRAGYKTELSKMGYTILSQNHKTLLSDVKLTRTVPPTDMRDIENYCLTTVNGFIHRNYSDETACYVLDAAKTLAFGDNNHMGLLSFKKIGKLIKESITTDQITRDHSSISLFEKTIIKVEDKEGHIPLLVAGGYLILPTSGIYYRRSKTELVFSFVNLNPVERILDASVYMDLTGVDINRKKLYEDGTQSDLLNNDLFMRRYLTLSQSFIVWVKADNLKSRTLAMRGSKLPGMYTTYTKPALPLMANHGKLVDYWHVEEDGQWSITTGQPGLYRDYITSTEAQEYVGGVSEATMPNNLLDLNKVAWLDIYSYT